MSVAASFASGLVLPLGISEQQSYKGMTTSTTATLRVTNLKSTSTVQILCSAQLPHLLVWGDHTNVQNLGKQ